MPILLSVATKAKFHDLQATAVDEGLIPGASYAVGTEDGEIYHGSAGLRFFEEPEKGPIDEESVFWICSMTKVVVTIALLQLVEKGKIDYGTPVDKYLPELANPLVADNVAKPFNERSYTPAKNKILVKHLLSHSSGLAYALAKQNNSDSLRWAYNAKPYEGNHTVEKFFSIIQEGLPGVPIAFEPGTSWVYGWNCEIVAFLVERITGQTIQEYCHDNIFTPLGVKMSFLLTPDKRDKLVQLTYRGKDGKLQKWKNQLHIIEQDPEVLKVFLGGIGIYSTMRDYLTFLSHILRAKAGKASNPILGVDTIERMFTPQIDKGSASNVVGFTGWPNVSFGDGLCLATEDWPGRRRKGSGFWYGWAGTYYFLDPSTGVVVVYGTQVVPTCDQEVVKLWENLERALYEGI
ncbi:hypothetical protein D9619_009571 [Psilocybe cf. subviscida]|uniref:Beta-lactamase-related domain-containing protein n=1 Tax=Psilocybe cf. subviscida TaxID=2480587 RepID=A0A8H5F5Y3_9AGAR|nr:hypothetical protein D9619_009571 [Psilocybe cf. subviscida]